MARAGHSPHPGQRVIPYQAGQPAAPPARYLAGELKKQSNLAFHSFFCSAFLTFQSLFFDKVQSDVAGQKNSDFGYCLSSETFEETFWWSEVSQVQQARHPGALTARHPAGGHCSPWI